MASAISVFKYLSIFTATIFSATCSTQVKAESVCEDVLKYASHNYSLEIQENSIAKRIYDQSCNESEAKSSESLDVGVDTIIESIPVKFNLGGGTSTQKLSRFCAAFSSDYKANSAKYEEKNLVSDSSVKAWRDCVTLYGAGVIFRPTINTTQAIVDITKKSADPIDVKGVDVDESKLKCSVSDDDQNKLTTKATKETRKHLVDGGAWQVVCDRTSQKGAGNTDIYPEANLSVFTTKGTFSVTIPADASIGVQSASELNAAIKSATDHIKDVEDTIKSARTQVSFSYHGDIAPNNNETVDFTAVSHDPNKTNATNAAVTLKNNRATFTVEKAGLYLFNLDAAEPGTPGAYHDLHTGHKWCIIFVWRNGTRWLTTQNDTGGPACHVDLPVVLKVDDEVSFAVGQEETGHPIEFGVTVTGTAISLW